MYDIKSRRLALNMTLEEVGEIVGVGKSTVRKWENGMIDNMKRDKIALLAKALKISPLVLLSEDSTVGENEHNITHIYNQLNPSRQSKVYHFAEHQLEEQNRLHTIKVLGQTAAGAPIEYGDVIEEKEVSYVPSGADIALVVNGDSMEPQFKDGSIVFYKKQETLENGELGIFEVNGGVTFKKLKMNGYVRLVSLNDNYDDIVVDENVEFKVLGKVIY